MLILLRYASLILAIILFIALIIGFSILIKNMLEARWYAFRKRRKKKPSIDELPLDAGIRDLIIQGKVIEAIALYQQFTGVDEFTARDAINDMQREIRLGMMENEVASVLEAQGKAAAIQAYQNITGKNFNDGLTFVEDLERTKR
ncbi:MAG: hypothetical protein AAF846_06960 [Chloroflexota bacterium]